MRNSRPSGLNAIASTATGTIQFTPRRASQTRQLLSDRALLWLLIPSYLAFELLKSVDSWNLEAAPIVKGGPVTLPKTIAYCSLAILIALYVVGAVSVPPGSLSHEVQTLPLWVPIVAGVQRREIAKWAALPCRVFWLAIML